jgi:tetratricopeptide (TPR) repeat protein
VPYARNAFFTGREALLTSLHHALQVENAVAVGHPQGISGLGGVGKTQLALEYAYRYREEYTLVFWVSADSSQALVASLMELADRLGLPERHEQSLHVVVEALWRWLRLHTAWLLIFDNMDDLSLAESWLPTAAAGHLLVTTRARALGRFAERLEVPTMDQQTGAFFLLRRAALLPLDACLDQAKRDDYRTACTISQELDGLPLAIDQAAAYIKTLSCPLDEYLERYRQRRLALLQIPQARNADYPASVATTWSLSCEKVARLNPAAAELLNLCAFLAPDAIPEELLVLGSPHLGDLLAPATSDPIQLDAACKAALSFSLIAREQDTQTVTMHRLVQLVIREGLHREVQSLWVERVMRSIQAALPDIDAAAQHELRVYVPHLLVCNTFVKDWQLQGEQVHILLEELIGCSYRINDFSSWVALADQALALYPADFLWYVWRGVAYKYLRDYQRALADMDTALALKPESAWGYTHRAELHMEMNDVARALTDMDAAFALDPQNTRILVHRALAHVGLGDYQSALLDLDAAVLLEPESAWVRTHRARLYGRLHEYQRAFADMRVACDLDARNAFLYVHRALLHLENADEQHALQDFDMAVACDPASAWVHIHRARLYGRMGDYQRALVDVNEGIALEPNNPWVYVQRALLIHHEMQHYQQALQDFAYALSLGPANAEYLTYRALTYRALEDYPAALHDLAHALVISPRDARTYLERALIYKAMGDYQQALADLQCAADITDNDPRISTERGTLYLLMGDLAQAERESARGRELAARYGERREPW